MYAGNPHWEHDIEGMGKRDTRVFSGLSPGDQLSRTSPPGRTGVRGRVSGVVNHVDRGRGRQMQGEDLRGDSPSEHALLERVVWEGGHCGAHLRESLARALKKNLL